MNISSSNISDFIFSNDVSFVELNGGSLISSNSFFSNFSLGSSPLISSLNSSLSLMNVRVDEVSGNGSIVEVDGFSYSSFDSISSSHSLLPFQV